MLNDDKKVAIVVDDDYFNLEVCAATLEASGYKVYKFTSSHEVIKTLSSQNFINLKVIALIDYQLTEINGIELIEKLIEKGYINIKYFILSACESSEIPKIKLNEKINYLKKPLEMKVLESML